MLLVTNDKKKNQEAEVSQYILWHDLHPNESNYTLLANT